MYEVSCSEAYQMVLPIAISNESLSFDMDRVKFRTMDDVRKIRLDNLRSILQNRFNGVIAELARAIGKDANYTRFILNPEKAGGRWIGEKIARDIEGKLRLSANWLDIPHQSESESANISNRLPGEVISWDKPDDLGEGYVLVDRYDVMMSAGNGHIQFVVHEKNPLSFRVEWFKSRGLKPVNCKALHVRGMSMEPYLQDGDTILINLDDKRIVDGQVYAVFYGDEYRVKRLIKTPSGLVLRSDNPQYPDIHLSNDDLEHVTILGRVVWRGG